MEQDRQLKEILSNSAEGASAGFTDRVMQKINGIAAAPLHYEPMVSPKLQKLFVFAFGAVIAAIFGLCLIIALTNPAVITWIQSIELPPLNYKLIVIFILSFWIVFAINSFIEKKFFLRERSSGHPA